MSQLQIRLLANFGLWYDGQPVTRINSSRLQSLLAYLVLHRDAPLSRQHVAFLFWPESKETQAYTNLRNLLYKLRRALPDSDEFLRADAQSLQWRADAAYSLDVASFERAAVRAEDIPTMKAAVDLYPGDLLPGFYEEWSVPVRDRLRQQFSQLLQRLIQQLEQQRDYQKAVRYAQRLLHHDPAAEAIHRDLMRLRALMGDRAGALRAFHACTTVLRRELGVEPDSQTRQLYQRLLQDESLPASTAEAEVPILNLPPLVGRTQEWEALQSAWRATGRRPRMVLLSGEAGIGKTRLAEELFEWIRRQGMAAARTRVYATEGRLAYSPVVSWLQEGLLWEALLSLDDVWLTEVARILPQLLVERLDLPPPEPLRHNWQRLRLFEALARAVLAIDRPLLLQIDDLQWCDQESLQWLHFLLRYDIQARLLIVGTVRSEDVSPDQPLFALLADLRQSRQLEEIQLQRLDEAEVAELANRVADRKLSPELIAHLIQETEGNPLFVVEMVSDGLPAGLDKDGVLASPLPPTVQAVITARLARLSPAARELVGLASVIGRAFTFEGLVQVSDAGEDRVVRALDELWQRRIVREQESNSADAYDFSHDKIRQTAYTELSRLQRRLWHRRVAESLETLHASHIDPVAGQIAVHYERAGRPLQAIPYFRKASEVAQQHYANEDAIQHIEQALGLLTASLESNPEVEPHTESSLREQLGDLFHLTGQYDAARHAYQDGLAHVSGQYPLWSSRLHLKVGNVWRTQHGYQEAQRAYLTAEQLLGPEPVEHQSEWWGQWVQIQIERMWVHYWLDRWAQIAEFSDKVRLMVARYGTPQQHISFLLALATVELRRDRYVVSDETITYGRESLQIAFGVNDLNLIAWVQFVLGMSLLWRDELDEAEDKILAALVTAETTGDVVHQSRCLTYLTILQRRRGAISQTRLLVERSMRAAQAADTLEYVGTAFANQAWIEWREGDFAAAWTSGQAALTAWQQLPAGHASCAFKWTALWPMMDVALQQDRVDEAVSFTQMLMDSSQQQLPDELTASLQAVLQAEDQCQPESVVAYLRQAVAAAQRTDYL